MEELAKTQQQSRHLVYVITEDWFFASHFLDRSLAALASGYRVTVITRSRETAKQLETLGLTFINIEFKIPPCSLLSVFAICMLHFESRGSWNFIYFKKGLVENKLYEVKS